MKQRLGHYEIVAELGRGGMGVVFKAVDPALDRIVAIKELAPALADDRTLVERFLREARAMAALSDPHVVNIHFIGQSENRPFFVMEYVEGESVSALLKRLGRIEVGDALNLVQQAALGLAAAHRRGLVHRDVKPANLLVDTGGRLRVADFGIALPTRDPSTKLTGTGEFVGTPGYVSPEICNGQPVDARSDVFSLGVVLFEMLTGRLPFADTSPLRLMLEVVNARIPDVQSLNGAVDAEAAAILGRMVAKDPAERYQHAGEVADALARHPLLASGLPLRLVVRPPDPDTEAANALQAARVPTPPPVVTPAATPVRPAAAAPAADGTMVRNAPAAPAQVHRDRRLAVAALVLLLLAGSGYAFRDYFRGFANGFRDGFVAGSVSNPVAAGQAATAAVPGAPAAAADLAAAAATADAAAAPAPAGDASPAGGSAAVAPATTGDPASGASAEAAPVVAAAPQPAADAPGASAQSAAAVPAQPAPAVADATDATDAVPTPPRTAPAVAARRPAPPRLAPARVLVVAQGDRLLALPARQAVERHLADAGHDLADAEALGLDEGDGVASLLRRAARHARVLVVVRAEPAGSRELFFHGQRDVAYTAALSVRAYDTASGQPLGAGLSEQVEFANLNARARAEDAVAPALPGLARQVAPLLVRRG